MLSARLQEHIERIEAFVSDIVAFGLFAQSDNAAILGALALVPRRRAAELLERIIVRAAFGFVRSMRQPLGERCCDCSA